MAYGLHWGSLLAIHMALQQERGHILTNHCFEDTAFASGSAFSSTWCPFSIDCWGNFCIVKVIFFLSSPVFTIILLICRSTRWTQSPQWHSQLLWVICSILPPLCIWQMLILVIILILQMNCVLCLYPMGYLSAWWIFLLHSALSMSYKPLKLLNSDSFLQLASYPNLKPSPPPKFGITCNTNGCLDCCIY